MNTVKKIALLLFIVLVILYGCGIAKTSLHQPPKGAPSHIEWQGEGGTILGF